MVDTLPDLSRRSAAMRLAAGAWGVAAVFYLASEGAAAFTFSPPYSYAGNYISDLGVPACGSVFDGRAICSPLHLLVNADFVLQGVLFFAAALTVAGSIGSATRYALVALAAVNGIGIAMVGMFPESGAATAGGGTLRYHALGAFLAIIAGNATALVSAFSFREFDQPRIHRVFSVALPLLGGVALAMLIVARGRGSAGLVPDGVWERISVYTITAWELLTAGCLLAQARTAPLVHSA